MLFALLGKKGPKVDRVTHMLQRLFHTTKGQYLVAILFGLAFAAMFQKVCKDQNCIVYISPPEKDIRNITYGFKDKCFQYSPVLVPCDDDTIKK